ncbi:MAG: MarR family winged helix-turn-helix transcriptional regulator [Caulobacteraceae bacterium]
MAKTRTDRSGPLDRSPSHLMHRALQRVVDLYASAAGPDAPTQRQYAVLEAVEADDGITQTGLVRATGIDRSTLAELVARMIAKGLLARERSPEDARANAVRLTDDGRAALERAKPLAAAADAAILKLLPSGKRAGFLNALARVASGEPRKEKKAKKEPGKGGKKAAKKAKVKAPKMEAAAE